MLLDLRREEVNRVRGIVYPRITIFLFLLFCGQFFWQRRLVISGQVRPKKIAKRSQPKETSMKVKTSVKAGGGHWWGG